MKYALDQSGEYVIAVGIGTVIEIQPELADDGHDQRSGEGRFLDVCKAVAKGSFLEKVCVILGRTLFVYGSINLNGQSMRSFSGLPLLPFWKTVLYQPY